MFASLRADCEIGPKSTACKASAMPPQSPPLEYLYARRWRIWGALLAAAIFALHPVQVESVAWVSETRGLLAGFFSLLSAWCYFQAIGKGAGNENAALIRQGCIWKPK